MQTVTTASEIQQGPGQESKYNIASPQVHYSKLHGL